MLSALNEECKDANHNNLCIFKVTNFTSNSALGTCKKFTRCAVWHSNKAFAICPAELIVLLKDCFLIAGVPLYFSRGGESLSEVALFLLKYIPEYAFFNVENWKKIKTQILQHFLKT